MARTRRRAILIASSGFVGLLLAPLISHWDDLFAKRVAVVVPGKLVRGAWQRPGVLERLIQNEHIHTIVTLTAINQDDLKYMEQAEVVRKTGVDWVLIPMRGSTATLDQMEQAADLLADPARQPVFFHCVAGHHRTSLAHAAYRIKHDRWTAEQAWAELTSFPWTKPGETPDQADRELIAQFAARQQANRSADSSLQFAKAAAR